MTYMYFYIQAMVSKLECYMGHKEKELSQIQHESLTKALMAQFEKGHFDGQLRGPVPEHQDYQKLREEVSQCCYNIAWTCCSTIT